MNLSPVQATGLSVQPLKPASGVEMKRRPTNHTPPGFSGNHYNPNRGHA